MSVAAAQAPPSGLVEAPPLRLPVAAAAPRIIGPRPSLENIQKERPKPLPSRWGELVKLGLLEPWQADELERDIKDNRPTAVELRRRDFSKQAARLDVCGSVFGYVACASKQHPNSLRQSFCNQPRLCPICAGIERRRIIEAHLPKLQLLEQHRPVNGARLRMITLTVRTADYPSQRHAFQAVAKGFTALWRGVLGGGRGKAPVGAIRAMEAAPKSGNVHAHVLFYGPYVAQAALADAWEKATGYRVCDVRAVDAGVRSPLGEVLKYVAKFDSLSPVARVDLWQQLKGIHRVVPYGLFRVDCLSRWLGFDVRAHLPGADDDEPQAFVCRVCGDTSSVILELKAPPRGPPHVGCSVGSSTHRRALPF